MGGLGNQLFQIAAALSVSKNSQTCAITSLTEPRKSNNFNSDIENFTINNRVLFLNGYKNWIVRKIINFSIRLAFNNIIKIRILTRIIEAVDSLILSIYFKTILKCKLCGDMEFDENLKLGKSNIFLIGYFQSTKWIAPSTLEFLSTMKPKGSQTLEMEKLANQMRIINPVSVHIRRGDYRNHPHFGLLSNDYYEIAITRLSLLKTFNEIWLFSDEPSYAISVIPNKIRERYKVVSIELSDPILEFELMRNSSGFIISNSTFSWWSAALRYKKEAPVLYPKPWFKEITEPVEIGMDDWVSIESKWE